MSTDVSHGEPNADHDPSNDPRHNQAVLGLIVGSFRFGVIFAIVGLGIASTLIMMYASLVVLKTTWDTISAAAINIESAKHLDVILIEVTDAFLLGTVLYIVALGLYQLFIDATLPVPEWLRVKTIDELKSKLVGVIVVLLAVTFLAEAVEGQLGSELLDLGVAVGAVILALGAYGYLSTRSEH